MTAPLEVRVALAAAGVFFLTGLATGAWKYRWMMRSADHQAPVYVDIAHRASLLYSFAALVIAEMLRWSPYPAWLGLAAAGAPLLAFSGAIATYVRLGWSRSTDNQFRERTWTTTWGMWMLIGAEGLGFSLLFGGFLWSAFLRPSAG